MIFQRMRSLKQLPENKTYFTSLGEIAENDNVSRNAVHGQLKNVEERLQFYEKSLHLYENRGKVLNLLSQISEKEIAKEIEQYI